MLWLTYVAMPWIHPYGDLDKINKLKETLHINFLSNFTEMTTIYFKEVEDVTSLQTMGGWAVSDQKLTVSLTMSPAKKYMLNINSYHCLKQMQCNNLSSVKQNSNAFFYHHRDTLDRSNKLFFCHGYANLKSNLYNTSPTLYKASC